MSKQYVWNKPKSVLSFKGNTLKHGDVIPNDFSERSLEKLIKNKKVIEFTKDNADEKKLKKLTDKLAGQKTGLGKANTVLSELSDNATDAVKKKATKKVTDLEAKISETETEIKNLTGGE